MPQSRSRCRRRRRRRPSGHDRRDGEVGGAGFAPRHGFFEAARQHHCRENTPDSRPQGLSLRALATHGGKEVAVAPTWRWLEEGLLRCCTGAAEAVPSPITLLLPAFTAGLAMT